MVTHTYKLTKSSGNSQKKTWETHSSQKASWRLSPPYNLDLTGTALGLVIILKCFLLNDHTGICSKALISFLPATEHSMVGGLHWLPLAAHRCHGNVNTTRHPSRHVTISTLGPQRLPNDPRVFIKDCFHDWWQLYQTGHSSVDQITIFKVGKPIELIK